MITKRIIPCLDVMNNQVVKGTKFKNIKQVSDPITLAKRYRNEMADELVFYDITASNEERNIFLNIVSEISKEIDIPFTVGGGIRTIEDFTMALRAGADKISINTAAILTPDLINQASNVFGNQCVVLSMDVKSTNGKWTIFTKGGRYDTGINPVDWAIEGVKRGAGELVINAIDQDGVKNGYDIELMNTIGASVNVPIIASGGAGKKEDFLEVFKSDLVDGALAASVFHYNTLPIPELKRYLASNLINMRIL